MKVYLASISGPNGISMFAGADKEELLSKLADYVNDQPETDWPTGKKPTVDLGHDDLVFLYFNGNEREFLDEDSAEIAGRIYYLTPGSGNTPTLTPDFDDSFRPQGTALS